MARFSYGAIPGGGSPVGRPRIPTTPPADGVELQDACLLGINRRVVHTARGNYAGTESVVRVRGVLNPVATSFLPPPFPSPSLPGLTGSLYSPGLTVTPTRRQRLAPGSTFEAIRNVLEQPRRQLWLEAGGHVILYSPSPGLNMDADNGPKCIGFEIVQWLGSKSAVVDLSYQTTQYDAHLYTTTPSVLIETEQEASEHIDQDGYSTVTIRGRALFDASRLDQINRLAAAGRVPDDFRRYLFIPPSDGMKRVSLDVHAPSDGRSLEWTIVDREMAHTILAIRFGVTRMEGSHTVYVQRESIEENNGGIARAGGSMVRPAGKGAGAAGGGLAKKALGIWGLAASALTGLAAKAIPRVNHRVVVRLWGNRNSNRQSLYLVGQEIIEDRIKKSGIGDVFGTGFNVSGWPMQEVTSDLMGKFVEVTAVVQSGPFASALSTGTGLGGGNVGFKNWPVLGQDERIEGGQSGPILGPGGGVQPPLPGVGGTDVNCRGGLVSRLAATALLGAYGTPRRALPNGPSVGVSPGYLTRVPPTVGTAP